MKSLFYSLILLAVIAGSVILLQSLDRSPEPPAPIPPSSQDIEVHGPGESPVDSLGDAAADELLGRGERLLATWHPRRAARAFERAVDVDSSAYLGWVRLVECYSHPLVEREDDARAALRRARALAPEPADTTFLNGLEAVFIDRDYPAAAADFGAASRSLPGGPSLDFYRARANYLAGRFDDAGDLVRAMGERGDPRALDLSVRILAARGDLDRAARAARDLAREHAQEPFPYVLLAQVELMRGDPAAAAEFCNNALVLDSGYVPAILVRACLYEASGDHEAARVSFEKLLLFDDPILRAAGQSGIAFVDFRTGNFGHGMDAMDEAVRDAIMAGAARRGLRYAVTLVRYLCELGRSEEAATVVEQWVSGFGPVPEHLASLRVWILGGDVDAARRALAEIDSSPEWRTWSRGLSIDPVELRALAALAAGEHQRARALVESDSLASPAVAGSAARRAFVRGYAAFESGDAEAAAAAFAGAREGLFGVEFPYHGDPVLDVQSLFYTAETALARGAEDEARTAYRSFLDFWGDASWDLPAVGRARGKLAALDEPPPGG